LRNIEDVIYELRKLPKGYLRVKYERIMMFERGLSLKGWKEKEPEIGDGIPY